MAAMTTNSHGDHESRTRCEVKADSDGRGSRAPGLRGAGGRWRPPAPGDRRPLAPRRHAGGGKGPRFLPGFLASIIVSACLGVLLWTRVNHNI